LYSTPYTSILPECLRPAQEYLSPQPQSLSNLSVGAEAGLDAYEAVHQANVLTLGAKLLLPEYKKALTATGAKAQIRRTIQNSVFSLGLSRPLR
jgi:hypothetical protein